MHIARTMMKVEKLSGLGHGTKQRMGVRLILRHEVIEK